MSPRQYKFKIYSLLKSLLVSINLYSRTRSSDVTAVYTNTDRDVSEISYIYTYDSY